MIIITVIIIIKLSLFHNLKTLTEKFFESFLEKYYNMDFPKMNIVANFPQTKPIYFGKFFFTSGMCLFETFS